MICLVPSIDNLMALGAFKFDGHVYQIKVARIQDHVIGTLNVGWDLFRDGVRIHGYWSRPGIAAAIRHDIGMEFDPTMENLPQNYVYRRGLEGDPCQST